VPSGFIPRALAGARARTRCFERCEDALAQEKSAGDTVGIGELADDIALRNGGQVGEDAMNSTFVREVSNG